ncbi:MAG: hypothetical protein R2873_36575 [Caldilineaceae bacterium]|nr:hypothetical protein [Caldilineaceae bacterium]
MNTSVFARAEEFIWKNARTLDRRLFAFHFKGGPAQAVIDALRAYQNVDGGFGNALEPDIRCPDSQPVPVQHALEILDSVGWDDAMAQRVCEYLVTITTDEGGVPFVLPSVRAYPRAPWWNTDDDPPASLNPTAAIAGMLHKHNVDHPWLAPATDFCHKQIGELGSLEVHQAATVFTFLFHAPDRAWAEAQLERLMAILVAEGHIALAEDVGYVRKPLDWAPTPDHPLRRYFTDAQIEDNLNAVLAAQREDGGWSIAWPPVSPSCELEWRGWITVNTLVILKANKRLGD